MRRWKATDADVPTPRGWARHVHGRIRQRALARPRTWWVLLTVGAVSVAAGVAMLVWPRLALGTFAVVTGIWLLVAGLVRLAAALLDRSRPRDRQRLSALVGLASVAAGLFCLGDPHATLGLLALVLALQWLVGGIVDIADGVRAGRGTERPWRIAPGVLSGVAGVVFLVWPAGSLVAFTTMTAVSAIGIGVLDIATGLRLRRFTHDGWCEVPAAPG